MQQKPTGGPDFQKIQKEMLNYFTGDNFVPVKVSADGLVTLKMDGRYQITSVTIQGVGLTGTELTRLEQAVLKAVNDATKEITKLNAEHLKQVMGESAG